jgi:hypothetical protein
LRSDLIFKTLGAAAILGGALRIADSFTGSVFDVPTLDRMYFATDVFLLLGTSGWYFSRSQRLGSPGLTGYALSVLGICIIRSAGLFEPRGYVIGAALFLIGLSVMNLLTLFRRDGPRAAPVIWIVSLVFAMLALTSGPLAAVAGVIFGLGFIAAGLSLWREQA